MNLIDALKTGRSVKRKGQTGFHNPHKGLHSFSITEILATDWEVEPERYEFECKFKVCGADHNEHIRMVGPGCGIASFRVPTNKKCKVTIEVIE